MSVSSSNETLLAGLATDHGLCSILVPTQNRQTRLMRTLQCLRAQTYRNIEIIVSDDGSTDDTVDLVEALGDERIRVVRSGVATGAAATRNRAAAAARGVWLAVCDDDDLWTPTKVERQLSMMVRSGTEWSYCFAALTDDRLSVLSEERMEVDDGFMHRFSSGNMIPGGCSTVVMRRSLFDDVGGFDTAFDMFADWDLWLRLASKGLPSYLPRVECLYVQHSGQMSSRVRNSAVELEAMRRKHDGHRRMYGISHPEMINWWVAVRLWRANERKAAVGVLLGPTPVRMALSIPTTFPRLVLRKLLRRTAISRDASEARDSVLRLLECSSAVKLRRPT